MKDLDMTTFDYMDYDIYRRDQARIRDWTFRVQFEAIQYDKNCVVTLTYDDKHLPLDKSVSVRHVQLFFKRLRKSISPATVRYFGCGEYGSKGGRPHYHYVLFGYCPVDLVFHHYQGKNQFFLSKSLADVWQNGFITVCPVVNQSVIPYVCKYLQKFNDFQGRVKPFLTMSRNPGVGYNALDSPLFDLQNDKLYLNGKAIRIPRYYLLKLKKNSFDRGFWYTDPSDGSLEFYDPKEHSDLSNDIHLRLFHDRIDELLKKRRDFWQGRFDCENYIARARKFKIFKKERNRPV